MTQEDKELLLKDLCARLPYNTLISIADSRFQCYGVHLNWRLIGEIEKYDVWNNIKPYLRPMSSMTEEELKEFQEFRNITPLDWLPLALDWLLEHHFDFMGLIPKDLAIEVTKENNPYK